MMQQNRVGVLRDFVNAYLEARGIVLSGRGVAIPFDEALLHDRDLIRIQMRLRAEGNYAGADARLAYRRARERCIAERKVRPILSGEPGESILDATALHRDYIARETFKRLGWKL